MTRARSSRAVLGARTSRRTSASTALVAAACSLAAAGCTASYSDTTIDGVSHGEPSSSVTRSQIQVPVGAVVTAHIAPVNSDGKPMVGEVRSHDTTILEIDPAAGDKVYALLGLREGQTEVDLVADGVIVQTIHAVVTSQ